MKLPTSNPVDADNISGKFETKASPKHCYIWFFDIKHLYQFAKNVCVVLTTLYIVNVEPHDATPYQNVKVS